MLAQAVELDVLHDDHAVGLLREDRVVDQLYGVDAIAGGEESQRGRDALRSTHEALALRILADLEQELADERFDFVFVHVRLLLARASSEIIPRRPRTAPRGCDNAMEAEARRASEGATVFMASRTTGLAAVRRTAVLRTAANGESCYA